MSAKHLNEIVSTDLDGIHIAVDKKGFKEIITHHRSLFIACEIMRKTLNPAPN